MKVKDICEKAIRGGWKPNREEEVRSFQYGLGFLEVEFVRRTEDNMSITENFFLNEIVFDPEFWDAIVRMDNKDKELDAQTCRDITSTRMHSIVDALIRDNSIEDFIEKL